MERGGTERVAEWARSLTKVPVEVGGDADPPPPPGQGRIVVGTAAAIKDAGPVALDLVAILDPDRALVRPGLEAGQRALAAWMEAAAWATGRAVGARVLVQTRRPGHPAIQALVRWEPEPYLRAEGEAAAGAGFPPGYPVFRIEGPADLKASLEAARPESVLTTGSAEGTVCLVAIHPDRVAALRELVLRLASEGLVRRVEAEPQL